MKTTKDHFWTTVHIRAVQSSNKIFFRRSQDWQWPVRGLKIALLPFSFSPYSLSATQKTQPWAIPTLLQASSLVTRTRFTRFTFITSGGGYSKSVGYKRTLHWFPYTYLVPSPHLSNIYKIVFLNH